MEVIPDAKTQISQEGTPPSQQDVYKSEMASIGQVEKKTLSPVNADSMRKEDSIEQAQNPGIPPRFGVGQDLNAGIENSGQWDTLPNGDKVWRLRVHSPSAKSLNFVFQEYKLPEGAELYIHSKQHDWTIGAFTAKNNKDYGGFSTDVVKGDQAVLEYYLPEGVPDKGKLQLERIIHAYEDMYSPPSGHGDAADCQVDVNCPEGDDWCLQQRSAVLILQFDDEDARICSGALLNDTDDEGGPYIMSAYHCLVPGESLGCENYEEDYIDHNDFIFRFQYWADECDGDNEPDHWYQIQGAEIEYQPDDIIDAPDFVVFEAQEDIGNWDVFYAGWDGRGNDPNEFTAIHHPSTDLMKISQTFNIADQIPDGEDTKLWCGNLYQEYEFDDQWYWYSIFDDLGGIESGSSGGPLFDENQRIVATPAWLIGDDCPGDPDDVEVLGSRFEEAFNDGLNDVLDPNDNNQFLNGEYQCRDHQLYFNTSNIPELTTVNNYIETGENIGDGGGIVTIETGEEVEFRAEAYIKLDEGTIIEEGAEFHATLEGECDVDNEDCNRLKTESWDPELMVITNKNGDEKHEENFETYDIGKAESLNIFPNPSEKIFNVEVNKDIGINEILIKDLKGRTYNVNIERKSKQDKNVFKIDASSLEPGAYIIAISSETKLFKEKIIKKEP